MPTYESINYALRPAKYVERRMIFEAASRLAAFRSLRNYRYVGFGATQFADFVLAHRLLGVENMFSIEREYADRRRFEFNRPFRSIKMRYGQAAEMLDGLRWGGPSIVWLDFDGRLAADVLDAVRVVADRADSGTLLCVTVNVHAGLDAHPLQTLKNDMGDYPIPIDVVKDEDVGDWNMASVARRIMLDQVHGLLTDKFAAEPEAPGRMQFSQVFNFRYKDNARMMTLGGLLHTNAHANRVQACRFDDLEYVRRDELSCRIRVPSLTHRETVWLDKQLPRRDLGGIEPGFLSKLDVESYAAIYRFHPRYSHSEPL